MAKEDKRMARMEEVHKAGEVTTDLYGFFEQLKMNIMAENVKGQGREDLQEKGNRQAREELRESGGRQNASANRGGTTDMDDEALTVDRSRREQRGSGISTKKEVTGSDYDGQLSQE